MIKKIYTILFCVLLQISMIPLIDNVLAGDEDNPEIEDEVSDVPFSFIDIVSAWFFEDSEDPDYLYMAIKLKNFQYRRIMTGYNIIWRYSGTEYYTLFFTFDEGRIEIFRAGGIGDVLHSVAGSCDVENNIIAMKIPKNIIGDPNPGDTLTRTCAFASFSSFAGFLVQFQIYSLYDFAPNNLQGKNYIIQY